MDLFTIFLVVFLLGYGVNVFVGDETLAKLVGVAAVVAGIVGVVRLVR